MVRRFAVQLRADYQRNHRQHLADGRDSMRTRDFTVRHREYCGRNVETDAVSDFVISVHDDALSGVREHLEEPLGWR